MPYTLGWFLAKMQLIWHTLKPFMISILKIVWTLFFWLLKYVFWEISPEFVWCLYGVWRL